MPQLNGCSTVPSWFIVSPDLSLPRSIVDRLREVAGQELNHCSGRPWLIGCWAEGSVATGQAGTTQIAVIGQHAISGDELNDIANRVHDVADLDRLSSSLVGSSHLIASVNGKVRIQGTVSGIRRVFHARAGDATLAADRADMLAFLLGTSLDEQRLASHLLEPLILHPLSGQAVWQGVAALPMDHYLVLDRNGGHRQTKWWSPPEPVVPLAEGALVFREALSAAVAARVQARPLVSCDLGGLDSTAVCCVAARMTPRVAAYTAESPDPLNDDLYWAGRTVAGLANIEHHTVPAEEMPLVYHGLWTMDDRLDEPCGASADRERWLIIARRAAARGSAVHLTGFGGDHVLYGSIAHLHTLLRTRPRTALRHLRGFAAKYRWRRTPLVRQLLDNRPYRAWLSRVAGGILDSSPRAQDSLLGWGFQPVLPPWVTPEAFHAVRESIEAEARTAEPLSPLRGLHRELDAILALSRLTRQFEQMAARLGITLVAPYLDDRVVEAGLSVRPEERVTPWRYKPLILEAMRGIVPPESHVRQTKANGSCDEEPGMRKNRGDLLALWEDSRLGRLGLIDADRLRGICSRPLPANLPDGVLYQTVGCEMWLRSLEGGALSNGGGNDGAQAAQRRIRRGDRLRGDAAR
jgi:asparagine synthase (glutamine-hydrolysing)